MLRLRRLWKIISVTIKYRLDTFINPALLPLPLRVLHLLAPWRMFSPPKASRGQRLRMALQDLGPIFIKFGQMLSTRKDLLPDDIADELAILQDNVPPFGQEQAVAVIEEALGESVSTLFASFDATPMASASIAQVHPATLHNGAEVVVKVVRPGIEKIIAQDVALMIMLANMLARLHPDGKRLRPREVVEDYRHTIFDELDLQKEAANTSQLRRNFIDSGLLYVPEVHWDYTRHNVFVMERIHGIPVTNIEALKAQNTDLKKLAERGVEIFFTQVFRDSFFHADMHPGNVFVSRENPQEPQYIGIDCAIIGSLSEFDQYYLARNLLAIFHRDYRLVAELHVECGWVPPETKATEFEAAIRSVCEPIFEKPLGEISFGQLLVYLFQTARRFDMEVQPSLVLLQKTLLNIEGLGRQLYPELDLWQTAQPFLEEWLKERYSPSSLVKQLKKYAPGWLEQLPQLPDRIFENLAESHYKSGQPSSTQHELQMLQQQFSKAQNQNKNLRWALVFLAAACWIALGGKNLPAEQISALSWLLGGAGVTLLFWRG